METEHEIYDSAIVDTEQQTGTASAKGFRVACRKLMLTYKHHLDKGELGRALRRAISSDITELYIAHENGDSVHGYPHTHVVLHVEKKFETTNARFFDFPHHDGCTVINVHPNIQAIAKKPKLGIPNDKIAWIRAVRYLGKEDPECKDLAQYEQQEFNRQTKGMKGLIENVMSAKTRLEAYEHATKPSDILGIDKIYAQRSIQTPMKLIDTDKYPPRMWHIDLMYEIMETKPFNRTITWYYDPKGNTGKTYFSKWAKQELGNEVLTLTTFGRHADTAAILSSLQEKGCLPRIMILDLSRSFSDKSHIYGTMEDVLNGQMTSTKYIGTTVNWSNEHFIVFSNFLPDVRKCSQDRWDIRELVQGPEDIEVVPMNYYDVLSANTTDALNVPLTLQE